MYLIFLPKNIRFSVHPYGEALEHFNAEILSDFLVSINIDEPRLGSVVLLREARFKADEEVGTHSIRIKY